MEKSLEYKVDNHETQTPEWRLAQASLVEEEPRDIEPKPVPHCWIQISNVKI